MDASSSSKHYPDEASNEKQQKAKGNGLFGLNCLIPLSFPFVRMPFSHPLLRQPTDSKPNPQLVVPNIVPQLQSSIISAVQNCFGLLEAFVSQNPLFNQLFSLSSHFQNFCQIRCRNYRNFDSLANHKFAAILPGDSVAGVVVANGILNFLNIYNTLLIVRLVLTWFPNSPPAIVSPLSTLCDPYLNIFRGIIPPLGGTLDLSPILAFLVLNAFTSTAAALPAELPSTGVSQEIPSTVSHLSTSEKKWTRRLSGSRSKGFSSDK